MNSTDNDDYLFYSPSSTPDLTWSTPTHTTPSPITSSISSLAFSATATSTWTEPFLQAILRGGNSTDKFVHLVSAALAQQQRHSTAAKQSLLQWASKNYSMAENVSFKPHIIATREESTTVSGLDYLMQKPTPGPNMTEGEQVAYVMPLWLVLSSMIALIVTFMVGVIGNGLVIIVVACFKDMKENSTNIFLANLSVADLLVILVCMPTAITEVFSEEIWYFGMILCKIRPFVNFTISHASIMTILLISFERYYAICCPLRAAYVCTRKHAYFGICFVWCIAVSSSLPMLVIAQLLEQEHYKTRELESVCVVSPTETWHSYYLIGMVSVFVFLPLAGLVFVYVAIGRQLMRDTHNQRHLIGTTTTTTNGNHATTPLYTTPSNSNNKKASATLKEEEEEEENEVENEIDDDDELGDESAGIETTVIPTHSNNCASRNLSITPNEIPCTVLRATPTTMTKKKPRRQRSASSSSSSNGIIINGGNKHMTIKSKKSETQENVLYNTSTQELSISSRDTSSSVVTKSHLTTFSSTIGSFLRLPKSFQSLSRNGSEANLGNTSKVSQSVHNACAKKKSSATNKSHVIIVVQPTPSVSLAENEMNSIVSLNNGASDSPPNSYAMATSSSPPASVRHKESLAQKRQRLKKLSSASNVTATSNASNQHFQLQRRSTVQSLLSRIENRSLCTSISSYGGGTGDTLNITSRPSVVSGAAVKPQQRSMTRQEHQRVQVVWMMAAVVVAFFICVLPLRCVTLWALKAEQSDFDAIGFVGWNALLHFTRVLNYVNSAINPVLYNFMSTKFRSKFRTVLFCTSSTSRYNRRRAEQNGYNNNNSMMHRRSEAASSLSLYGACNSFATNHTYAPWAVATTATTTTGLAQTALSSPASSLSRAKRFNFSNRSLTFSSGGTITGQGSDKTHGRNRSSFKRSPTLRAATENEVAAGYGSRLTELIPKMNFEGIVATVDEIPLPVSEQ